MAPDRLTGPAVSAAGLVKSFGDVHAVDGVDLEVARGTVQGLLGPNGAGKTTVVRMLATLLLPDGGRAEVLGFDIVTDANEVRRRIALTGQFAAVDEILTGRENLRMFGRLMHLERSVVKSRADELLERFDPMHAADRPAKTYSGGMRRRLDLASSMLGRPEVLFLDEPTTGLDPRSRNSIWAAVREMVGDGTTVFLTTQYLEEADQLADRIAVIDRGKVVAEGTESELKDQVGGQMLEIRLANDEDRERAAGALDGLGCGEPQRTEERGMLAVQAPVDGVGMVAEAARVLKQAEIQVSELGLRRPTLDDVFLELTGEPAGAQAGEAVGPNGDVADPRDTGEWELDGGDGDGTQAVSGDGSEDGAARARVGADE
ncbi:MAG: ATP-binding cassette domain-containing protein [Solirubrobacterales bacterium]